MRPIIISKRMYSFSLCSGDAMLLGIDCMSYALPFLNVVPGEPLQPRHHGDDRGASRATSICFLSSANS